MSLNRSPFISIWANIFQRRRSEEDEKLMRHYLKEGDLISVSFLHVCLYRLKIEI